MNAPLNVQFSSKNTKFGVENPHFGEFRVKIFRWQRLLMV